MAEEASETQYIVLYTKYGDTSLIPRFFSFISNNETDKIELQAKKLDISTMELSDVTDLTGFTFFLVDMDDTPTQDASYQVSGGKITITNLSGGSLQLQFGAETIPSGYTQSGGAFMDFHYEPATSVLKPVPVLNRGFEIDLTSLDNSKKYPVSLEMPSSLPFGITCEVTFLFEQPVGQQTVYSGLGESAKFSIGLPEDGSGYASCNVEYLNNEEGFINSLILGEDGSIVLYLIGGFKYHMQTNAVVQVHESMWVMQNKMSGGFPVVYDVLDADDDVPDALRTNMLREVFHANMPVRQGDVDTYKVLAYAHLSAAKTIAAGKNIASVTGDSNGYTVNFKQSLPTANYLAFVSGEVSGAGAEIIGVHSQTTSGFKYDFCGHDGTMKTPAAVNILVLGPMD